MAPTPSDLPQRLRVATRALHQAAERSGVMAALLQGRLPHADYRRLLGELLALYAALEAALDSCIGAPWLGDIALAPLRRAPALAADLADHNSSDAAAGPPLTAETQAYVERLQRLGAEASPALLAHVYTRYLGDLHGGQILQGLVRRQFPGQATASLDFGGHDEVISLQQGLRTALATAPLSAAQADAVVTEACWSFEQHRRLFEALAAR